VILLSSSGLDARVWRWSGQPNDPFYPGSIATPWDLRPRPNPVPNAKILLARALVIDDAMG
jgi:hypothetical protein